MSAALDLLTIGRSSVDLYGQQIGGRLEDMASFVKSVGGCPTNIAIGTARLGLRSGVITRVGDEHMGRFIREQLVREGVSVDGVATDPERLTALVLLGVRDEERFPLIFYRDNCADGALCEADIDEDLVRRVGAVLVTGTHFARPHSAQAQFRAIGIARANGARVILDADYRPNLWGLAGHGAGENRYVRAASVTATLAPVLPLCDLIVGTEEELHIAGGSEDTIAAVRAIRAVSDAMIVCKRGALGCVAFPSAIPETIEDGVRGPAFPVEIYNILGAGDAFMSGFLRGWLRREPLETCCRWGNACGAFAVSRLLCSTESPTWAELTHFLARGSAYTALRHDPDLNQVHWATTRRPQPATIMALAIDHRAQLEEMARDAGAPPARIGRFKELAVEAAVLVSGGRPGFGLLLDGTYGRTALFRAAGQGLWIGRPVERPGSRPLDFDGLDSLGAHLAEWPVEQVVKCLCLMHPDDPEELRLRQERELRRVFDASRTLGRELLIEIIAGRHGTVGEDTVARVIAGLYAIGIRPDWWKLEAQATDAAWTSIGRAIDQGDPHCRGVLMLGLDAPMAELEDALAVASRARIVQGFAIGRTIFAEAARAWLGGALSDAAAVEAMAARFSALVALWRSLRGGEER